MCGVAGRFHPVALGGAPGWAPRVSALLAHRGPDGEGHYSDDRCELVHRRLALIDLSPTGHQPMANEDGSVYVVFNGEIYNHRDLRSELERRGHRFRGTSDTEVLVHLYEEYGEHMADRLRGIFAFAIYDSRRRALYLARDRFGVKPLFYALHSGGIDSSLVVAAHRRATGGSTATFNVRFPAKSHDETAIAVAVARHCGTAHRTIDLRDWNMSSDAVLDLLRHFDQPFADLSLLPMYWISRAIRDQGIICALSGDGGDEAFGGYARFWRANRLVQLMQLPPWLGNAVRLGGRALAGWTRDWGRQVAKAVQLAQAGASDGAFLISGLSNYLSEDDKRDLVRPIARNGFLPAWRHYDAYDPPGVTDLEELSQRMTETLVKVSLPSDMLRKVDMMSMRASIEVRVPMLDEDVVALGLTLPHRLKTDGTTGKQVLRALAHRWLPPVVAAHPKHGFAIPVDVMVPDAV